MVLGIARAQHEMAFMQLPVVLRALCRPPDYADPGPEAGFPDDDRRGGVGIIATT
jgi:hypothetical protein